MSCNSYTVCSWGSVWKSAGSMFKWSASFACPRSVNYGRTCGITGESPCKHSTALQLVGRHSHLTLIHAILPSCFLLTAPNNAEVTVPPSLLFFYFLWITTSHNPLVSPSIWSFLYPVCVHAPPTLLICRTSMRVWGQKCSQHPNNQLFLYLFIWYCCFPLK